MSRKLYIKVDESGMFVDHPHFDTNLHQLYPDHDFTSGPPSGWMEFERVKRPELGVYELFEENIGGNISIAFPHNGLEYAIVDGKYKDVWHTRAMTAEEKATKIQRCHDEWAESYPDITSWVFDESLCEYLPPVPYPDDGQAYIWDEPTTSWVLAPDDGSD